MNEVALLVERDYPWLRLIAAKSAEGASWVEEYNHPDLTRFNSTILGTFKLLARGRLDEVRMILEQAETELHAFESRFSKSVLLVHECWFCGVLAYYYYFGLENYSRAEKIMLRGHSAVASAIQEKPVLLPSVYRCCDTWLHRARIARNQRNWSAMKERIATYRSIMLGEKPFCTLNDGRNIYAADLDDYMTDLTFDDETNFYLNAFRKSENQANYSFYQAQKVFVLPWLPIQY